jgi:hypothetical protein
VREGCEKLKKKKTTIIKTKAYEKGTETEKPDARA